MPTKAELVTPERVLFSGEAEFVVLRTDGGEIMFLPNHAPFIGAIDISVVRIALAGSDSDSGSAGEFRAAAHGGFVHVSDNTVTVLASVAEPADEIDLDRARRALETAQAGIAAGEGREGREGREGESAVAVAEGEGASEHLVQSSTMRALLAPDDPDVALRRAEARLEAADAPDGALAPAVSP